jgi:hypothetical protein
MTVCSAWFMRRRWSYCQAIVALALVMLVRWPVPFSALALS